MTQTITLTANQISQIISVSPGTRITSSGNGSISWVAGSLVDAKNGSGTWAEWAKGSSAGYIDAVRQMCIRATATGNMTVTLDEGRADKYPENVYFDTELVSVQTNSYGSVSLVAPIGGFLRGALSADEWFTVPSIFRLRLTGTGTVTIDSKDALGSITTGIASYTVTDATNQIEFPYAGDAAVMIRATLTGSATAEVI